MANLFKPSEVLKIAIKIEENGLEYYLEVKKRTPSKEAADLFQFLADEEVRHLAIFTDMLNTVGNEKVAESYPGEHNAYFKVLADSHVFTKNAVGKEMVAKAKNDREIIEFALGFERESVLLYCEMIDLVPATKKSVVEEVIREEKSHVKLLNEIRGSI